MAVVGIHKALLQVTHLGALLGHHLLTLLHLCLQGLHVQGLLQLCSPGPVLIHLALEALVLILSLLHTSHQSKHVHTLDSTMDHMRHHVSQATHMHRCCCHSLLCHTAATQVILRHRYWHEH